MVRVQVLLLFLLTATALHAFDGIEPWGWAGFCGRHPAECSSPNLHQDVMVENSQLLALLGDVNRAVNRAVTYQTDQRQFGLEDFWTYPETGRGDCEDYALEKRRRLRESGLPNAALLLTYVLSQGLGHLVLAVKTDRGFLILDNQTDAVLAPDATGHAFISRQSEHHPNRWVSWWR